MNMDYITCDRTLQVGDLVFSTYHKGDYVFRITSITRRFLDITDLRYSIYKNAKVGEEYNPITTVEAVANFEFKTNKVKKFRKITAQLDASYLIKATPDYFVNQITKLNDVLNTLWP